jgi:hypothetical protein
VRGSEGSSCWRFVVGDGWQLVDMPAKGSLGTALTMLKIDVRDRRRNAGRLHVESVFAIESVIHEYEQYYKLVAGRP